MDSNTIMKATKTNKGLRLENVVNFEYDDSVLHKIYEDPIKFYSQTKLKTINFVEQSKDADEQLINYINCGDQIGYHYDIGDILNQSDEKKELSYLIYCEAHGYNNVILGTKIGKKIGENIEIKSDQLKLVFSDSEALLYCLCILIELSKVKAKFGEIHLYDPSYTLYIHDLKRWNQWDNDSFEINRDYMKYNKTTWMFYQFIHFVENVLGSEAEIYIHHDPFDFALKNENRMSLAIKNEYFCYGYSNPIVSFTSPEERKEKDINNYIYEILCGISVVGIFVDVQEDNHELILTIYFSRCKYKREFLDLMKKYTKLTSQGINGILITNALIQTYHIEDQTLLCLLTKTIAKQIKLF